MQDNWVQVFVQFWWL